MNTFLMCEPHFYDVEYVINPYMEGNIHAVDKQLAHRQWRNLYDTISKHAKVELIDPAPGLPDMVFTANAGLPIVDLNYIWLSKFAKTQRSGEPRLFHGWFIAEGFDVLVDPRPAAPVFEGAGDGLIDCRGEYWLAYGQRSSEKAAMLIQKFFDNKTFHILELTDPYFYHLDTCFCPLSKGQCLLFKDAFSVSSYWMIAMKHGKSSGIDSDDQRNVVIEVDEADAKRFACNAVCIGDTVIMPECSDDLIGRIEAAGYTVQTVDLSEFLKAGGAAKCLTLLIH
ncbi:MAG: hypothetical protein E4H14_06195 [Candidatus Thorarchaeota archaeon]|nr:MAG: hypothetical protein E4H14_06195 [Candidatus Thorarchaeota archaeon]